MHLIIENIHAGFKGAGIYAQNSSFIIKNSVIKNNKAGTHWGAEGAGLALFYSSIIFENVEILNNEALDGMGGSAGGGIYCNSSNLYLINTSICNNRAPAWWGGGGIAAVSSNLYILNSTISNNDIEGIHAQHSDVTIVNSILWNNQWYELNFDILDRNNIVLIHSDVEDSTAGISINNHNKLFWLGRNFNTNPKFVDPTSYNYNLQSSSPCIDAGVQDTFFVFNNNNDTIHIPEIDYLGFAPDIGAFEFDPATNILNDKDIIPSTIKLFQNYPNPFNSTTTIEYYLPHANNVKIELYNILGQKLKTVVNNYMFSGFHKFQFNVVDLPSGFYLYKIITGNFQQTKKMLLLK